MIPFLGSELHLKNCACYAGLKSYAFAVLKKRINEAFSRAS